MSGAVLFNYVTICPVGDVFPLVCKNLWPQSLKVLHVQ